MQTVDLFDPKTFERGVPHDYLAWLREHEPVHWQPPGQMSRRAAQIMEAEQNGFWAITRHRDVVEVSLDQKRFSSERGTVVINDLADERIGQLRLWMINQDAPRHTRLRKLVNKGFTKRMIQQMEAHIRKLSKEIVDSVARKGKCDFVTAIASELPLLVIAELVGCPLEDRGKLMGDVSAATAILRPLPAASRTTLRAVPDRNHQQERSADRQMAGRRAHRFATRRCRAEQHRKRSAELGGW